MWPQETKEVAYRQWGPLRTHVTSCLPTAADEFFASFPGPPGCARKLHFRYKEEGVGMRLRLRGEENAWYDMLGNKMVSVLA